MKAENLEIDLSNVWEELLWEFASVLALQQTGIKDLTMRRASSTDRQVLTTDQHVVTSTPVQKSSQRSRSKCGNCLRSCTSALFSGIGIATMLLVYIVGIAIVFRAVEGEGLGEQDKTWWDQTVGHCYKFRDWVYGDWVFEAPETPNQLTNDSI